MEIKQSELKDILTARNNERRMVRIGLIFVGVLLTATVLMFAHALIISVDVIR
jgi:hypothetical protein